MIYHTSLDKRKDRIENLKKRPSRKKDISAEKKMGGSTKDYRPQT